MQKILALLVLISFVHITHPFLDKLLTLAAPLGRVHKFENTLANGVSEQTKRNWLIDYAKKNSALMTTMLLRAKPGQEAKETAYQETATSYGDRTSVLRLLKMSGINHQSQENALKNAAEHQELSWFSNQEKAGPNLKFLLTSGYITDTGKQNALNAAIRMHQKENVKYLLDLTCEFVVGEELKTAVTYSKNDLLMLLLNKSLPEPKRAEALNDAARYLNKEAFFILLRKGISQEHLLSAILQIPLNDQRSLNFIADLRNYGISQDVKERLFEQAIQLNAHAVARLLSSDVSADTLLRCCQNHIHYWSTTTEIFAVLLSANLHEAAKKTLYKSVTTTYWDISGLIRLLAASTFTQTERDSLLHEATLNCNYPAVQHIVSLGVSSEAVNNVCPLIGSATGAYMSDVNIYTLFSGLGITVHTINKTLIEAAKNDKRYLVEKLLQGGMSVNAIDAALKAVPTSSAIAAGWAHEDVISQLINANATQQAIKDTILLTIEKNDSIAFNYLLNHNHIAPSFKIEAAFFAYKIAKYSFIPSLLSNLLVGADKAACQARIINELVAQEHLKLIEDLIAFDGTLIASLQAEATTQSKHNVLQFLSFIQKPEMVHYRKRRGAAAPLVTNLYNQQDCLLYNVDPQSYIKNGGTITDRTFVNTRNEQKQTCLMWAIIFGHPDVFDALLGVNLPKDYLNAKDAFGYSAFDYAGMLDYGRYIPDLMHACHTHTFVNRITGERKTLTDKKTLLIAAEKATQNGNALLAYNMLSRLIGMPKFH